MKITRHIAICLFLFALNSLLFANDTERILSYSSYISVHKDRTLRITETIKVISASQKIQRGIYRTFPTKYKDRFGNTVQVQFEILKVLKNGDPEPYHTQAEGNGVKIYIGSENVYLDPGEYTYTLTYLTDRQLGFFKDFDELYWNVTGNDWDFVVEYAEAVIELPSEANIIHKIAYTGYAGHQGQNYTISTDENGNVKFSTTDYLNPREGFTIAVSWQKGVIQEPTAEEKLGYLFWDNKNTIAAFLGLITLLIYFLVVWSKVGKDPPKGTIIPRFEPPAGFSPAATHYVMRMGYSDRVFTAAVVNMAIKKYLTITEKKGEYTLTRIKKSTADLSSGERKIANKLFVTGDRIALKQRNHTIFQNAISSLKYELEKEFEKLHFRRNRAYFTPGILITILTLVAVVLASPQADSIAVITFWITLWTFGTSVLVFSVVKAWRSAIHKRGVNLFSKVSVLGLTLFSLPFVAFAFVGLFIYGVMTSMLTLVCIITVFILDLLFYNLLKAPTILGRRVMDHIEGFKMYLETAEKQRLNMLHAPEMTPSLFEKYLPYALALDVENEWCEQFNEILNAAGQSDSYSPSWYIGRSWDSISSSDFASSIGASLSGAISSSSTSPGSSSGSGGGGSSGGGGGGGGGGGW